MIETLSLEEIDATLSQLRTRRRMLKSSGQVAQRKIAILAGRRERLFTRIHALDEQIAHLNSQAAVPATPPTTTHGRRRGAADVAFYLNAIVACVSRHTEARRATIIDECRLSPTNTSIYLRQLCQEGRLVRRGEKRAATYMVPECGGVG